MFDNVYWHHTNRAAMAMLLRAVQEALLAGAISAGDLTGLDDAELMRLLLSEAMPETTVRICTALSERRFHKRALEVSSKAGPLYERLAALYSDGQRDAMPSGGLMRHWRLKLAWQCRRVRS